MRESASSKKFLFAIGACLIAFAYAVLAGSVLPHMAPMYETFCGILEVVTGAYIVGNVGNKWVLGKATVSESLGNSSAPKKMKVEPRAEPADPLDRDEPSR